MIGKYVSEYPASCKVLGTQYGEAFAELYSDEDTTRPVKKIFDKVLNEKLEEIYGGK